MQITLRLGFLPCAIIVITHFRANMQLRIHQFSATVSEVIIEEVLIWILNPYKT